MATVAVTGAAGYLGARVVSALCRAPDVDRVVGLDVRPLRGSHPRLVFDVLDVRDAALTGRLRGVDILVHLAFIMDPLRDEALMHDVNVNGTRNVLESAVAAGVKKMVYASSAVVYGAHPDNPLPLTEDAPLRANVAFSYAAHKLEVEEMLADAARDYPDIRLVVLRPAIVFGPRVDNAWSHVLEWPVLVAVAGSLPPFQFVHEDDVVSAITHSVFADLRGAYNVAPPDWIAPERIAALVRKRRITVSERAARVVLDGLWRSRLSEIPPEILPYVRYPWVVAPDRLAGAGWSARRGSEEALVAALGGRRHVRVGPARVPSPVVRAGLASGAAAGIALAGRARRRR